MSFELRVFRLGEERQESGRYETETELEDARRLVQAMREFMAGRASEFKEAIPFLKRGAVELEWNAGSGGVAFFSWTVEGAPAAFGAMVADAGSEAGSGVLGGFARTMMLENAPGAAGETVWFASLPGRPETVPLLQLLTGSLAAVFFGAVRQTRTQTP